MSQSKDRVKIPVWRFYEHSFSQDVTLAWRQDPDGNVSYLGRVKPGTAGALAKAFAMNSRSALFERGLPRAFEDLLN